MPCLPPARQHTPDRLSAYHGCFVGLNDPARKRHAQLQRVAVDQGAEEAVQRADLEPVDVAHQRSNEVKDLGAGELLSADDPGEVASFVSALGGAGQAVQETVPDLARGEPGEGARQDGIHADAGGEKRQVAVCQRMGLARAGGRQNRGGSEPAAVEGDAHASAPAWSSSAPKASV